MRKQDFVSIYSDMMPDEQMRERIEKNVLNIKEKNSAKRVSFKKIAAFAVSLAIIGSIGASLPIMAEHIPAVKNALSYFTGGESYAKEPLTKNDAIAEIAETIDASSIDSENNISLTVQNVYYDNKDVLIYYVIEAYSDKFKDYTTITSKDVSLYADGKEVVYPTVFTGGDGLNISCGRCDDGVFMGMMKLKSSYLPKPKNDILSIRLDVNSIEITDYTKVYFNYDTENPLYAPRYDTYKTDISCSFEMKRQETIEKIYEINQEKEGIKLNSVKITPVRTILDIESKYSDTVCVLTDDSGNEIEYLYEEKYAFDTPLKSAKSLTLKFFDCSHKNESEVLTELPEICSFTFDIDGGYRNEDSFNNQSFEFEPDRITYIPPEEETEKWAIEQGMLLPYSYITDATPFNEWRDFKYENSGEFNDMADYSVKINNVEYVKNVNELDLENGIERPVVDHDMSVKSSGDIINKTLVVLEITIKNNEAVPREYNARRGYIALKFNLKESIKSICGGSPYYMTKPDKNGKRDLCFDFDAYEERTIKLGYLVPTCLIKDGIVYVENRDEYDCIEFPEEV